MEPLRQDIITGQSPIDDKHVRVPIADFREALWNREYREIGWVTVRDFVLWIADDQRTCGADFRCVPYYETTGNGYGFGHYPLNRGVSRRAHFCIQRRGRCGSCNLRCETRSRKHHRTDSKQNRRERVAAKFLK